MSHVFYNRQMASYLQTMMLCSAISGKVDQKLNRKLFNILFGEFTDHTSKQDEEMMKSLDEFVSNYVVRVRENKLAGPIQDLNI